MFRLISCLSNFENSSTGERYVDVYNRIQSIEQQFNCPSLSLSFDRMSIFVAFTSVRIFEVRPSFQTFDYYGWFNKKIIIIVIHGNRANNWNWKIQWKYPNERWAFIWVDIIRFIGHDQCNPEQQQTNERIIKVKHIGRSVGPSYGRWASTHWMMWCKPPLCVTYWHINCTYDRIVNRFFLLFFSFFFRRCCCPIWITKTKTMSKIMFVQVIQNVFSYWQINK